MARRENDLFIGAQYMNIEGRSIKHPALIKHFATVNLNKTSDDLINLIGIDIETDPQTADLKLLGFYKDEKYAPYYLLDDFIPILFTWVKHAYKEKYALAYWNKLDPFVLYKQFLYKMDEKERNLSMSKFGKVSGEWDKEEMKWLIKPLCEVKLGDNYFGITNVIRSSIQFFFRKEHDEDIKTIWAFDIAGLYQNGLEKEAKKNDLTYYSKIEKGAHLVDWDRFQTDEHYKHNIVLKSNELDARAVRDLGYIIQEQFKHAFKFYPRTLISQGSLARSAIIATLSNMHNGDRTKIADDVKSIGMINYMDTWANEYGKDTVKDLFALMFEAYSGGQIEAYRYGFTHEAYTCDLTQAYPYHIQHLLDLRGAEIRKGTGKPPSLDDTYTLIRGDVNIPLNVDYHPLTVKHPFHKDTNVRAVGEYRASYTLNERDFLEELGATFNNEEWYQIITKGQLSPLAKVCKVFTDLREELRPVGKDYIAKTASASLYGILFEAVDTWVEQKVSKEIKHDYKDTFYKDILKKYKNKINCTHIKHHLTASQIRLWHNKDSKMYADMVKQELEHYGIHLTHEHPIEIMHEIDKLYRMDVKLTERIETSDYEVLRDGYRGGEFLNALYALIITSETRLQISRTANEIKRKGGEVILAMTDSLFYKGTADMIPQEMIREKKTVGYFEPVELVKDLVVLGIGRYGYKQYNKKTDKWETAVAKKRGLNAVEIHDPTGITLDEFNWLEALKILKRDDADKIKVKVRNLLSVGLINHVKVLKDVVVGEDDNGKEILQDINIDFKDLGRVIEVYRDVEAIVGKTKRLYDVDIEDASVLIDGLVETKPLHLSKGMFGKYELNDQTLSELRNKMMLLDFKTAKEKKRAYNKVSVSNYHSKKKDDIKEYKKANYELLKEYGYNSKERSKMQHWSIDRIKIKLMEDEKI